MAEIKKECDKDFVSNIKFQLNLGHPVMILLKDTDCTWIKIKKAILKQLLKIVL